MCGYVGSGVMYGGVYFLVVFICVWFVYVEPHMLFAGHTEV